MVETSHMIGGPGPPRAMRPGGASSRTSRPLPRGWRMPRGLSRTARRHVVAVLFVLALAGGVSPVPVLAQPSTPVSEILRRGVDAGIDEGLMRSVAERARQTGTAPEATAEMLAPAVRLAEAGLPATPVLNKVLEGLAKRVPPARVQSVADRLAGHVQQVGPVVDTWLQREDVRAASAEVEGKGRADIIVSAANARQQGLALDDVQLLLAELPGRARGRRLGPSNVAAAVRATAEMPRDDADPSGVREIVLAAVEAGYTADEIGQLPVALRQAQARANRPLPALARDARRAISRGTPASEVIGQLSRGRPPLPPPAAGRGGSGQGPPPGQGKPPNTGPPDSPPGGPPDTPPQGPPLDPPGGPPGGGG